MKKITIIAIHIVGITILAFGGYRYFKADTPSVGDTHEKPQATASAFGARAAGTRIVIRNPLLSPGSQALSFEFYGKDGHPFGNDDIEITHEKKIHLIIVNEDFSSYQHVHPSYADGVWSADIELANDTSYQAYFDSDPAEEGPQVLRVPFRVGVPAPASKVSQRKNAVTVAGITATLIARTPIMSGDTLAFSLARAGRPLGAEPYLGAKGHVIAISHTDPDNFVHAHPITHDGADADVDFGVDVPVSGTYTLFAQFKTEGIVRTFPFTLVIARGENAASATDHHDEKPDAARTTSGETHE